MCRLHLHKLLTFSSFADAHFLQLSLKKANC